MKITIKINTTMDRLEDVVKRVMEIRKEHLGKIQEVSVEVREG